MTRDARVLVLGSGGRVGRLIRQVWEQHPALPRAVFQSRCAGRGITLVGDPMADPDGEAGAGLTRFRGDMIVALWGVTPHTGNGDLALNSRLALLALEAARAAGVPRVVLISTGAVYAPPGSEGGYCEDTAAFSAGAYGQAKIAMEVAARNWAQDAGPQAPAITILRLANVAGADMLADAVRCATPGAPLRLDRFASGGGPRRSYLAPHTLAAALGAICAASPTPGTSIFNLADGDALWDMADLLQALTRAGHSVPWGWQAAPPAALYAHQLNVTAFAGRFPEVAGQFRPSADALVADWLSASGGRP